MTETEPRYVKVHSLSNRFEADVIADALKQEGIPVLVRSFEETPYAGLFVPQRGWGRIMVPKEMADLAREIISGLVDKEEAEDLPFKEDFEIDPRLWDSLRHADPREMSQRALVQFDSEENVWVVPFLNTAVLCYPETEEIEVLGRLEHMLKASPPPGSSLPKASLPQNSQLALVILHYLLYAQNKPAADKWVSEKDLPGGGLFFTAMHTLPMEPLAEVFDGRPDLLDAVARSIGGGKIDSGGLSYRFRILPRIPIRIIFWSRDEEFEPSFHVLFDESIVEHLRSLDLIWGLVNIFAGALLECAGVLSNTNDE